MSTKIKNIWVIASSLAAEVPSKIVNGTKKVQTFAAPGLLLETEGGHFFTTGTIIAGGAIMAPTQQISEEEARAILKQMEPQTQDNGTESKVSQGTPDDNVAL